MKRLTVFAKGNVDVHDALHSCRIGGTIVWNGINEALRATHPGRSIRLRHETWTRSDALLASNGAVPAAFSTRALALGAYPLASQFSRALFESDADAVVLSIQPDIMTGLVRHRRDGSLLYASDAARWSARDRDWLAAEFDAVEPLRVADSMRNLSAIVRALRGRRDVPILIANVSSITPGETLHDYRGFEDTLSLRIREFNVALVRLSQETGISIVDVDALVARHGSDSLKLDTTHLTADGYRVVAHEVVRILDDLGYV